MATLSCGRAPPRESRGTNFNNIFYQLQQRKAQGAQGIARKHIQNSHFQAKDRNTVILLFVVGIEY